MTALHPPLSQPASQSGAYRLAPALFAVTLFLSALLLFAVQPMFTKMVLPRLGGAPTVWSVAMVFFQAALLAGYLYAHLLIRFLPLGLGALVHLAILAAAAMTLPISIALGFDAPPTSNVAIWLIGLFAVSIGLPFAALSASAPLLQGWFAASGNPQSGNPYVLYAASNLGSFAALLAYPIIIEPLLSLNRQVQMWSIGFAVLVILIAATGLFIARRPSLIQAAALTAPVSTRDRLAWVVLSAIPAGLVIAVTSYMTTDVAAAPFLWVAPLALYLLTFVGVFRDRPWIRHQTVAVLVPFVVAPLAIGLLGHSLLGGHDRDQLGRALPARNAVPWRSLSQASGSRTPHRVLSVRIAGRRCWRDIRRADCAHIFSRIDEYPILIVAAVLVLPGVWTGGVRRLLIEAGPALLIAAAAVCCEGRLRPPAAGVRPTCHCKSSRSCWLP